MSALTLGLTELTTPGEADATQAGEIYSRLAHRATIKDAIHLSIGALNGTSETIQIPTVVFEILITLFDEMAKGHAVRLVSYPKELTTYEAAAMLNVTRPFLIRLLDRGCMPFHRVGPHRRVRLEDVIAYWVEHDRSLTAPMKSLS